VELVNVKTGEAATQSLRAKRTVWGLWPILLSLSLAVVTVIVLGFELLASHRSAGQTAEMQRTALALVPMAVLIGQSVLIAKHLPQTAMKPWVRQAALWASFLAVLAVSLSIGIGTTP
jgi:uncharacterized membrane protein